MVAVDVHGVACEEADRVVRANRVVLECKLNPDVVGLKNVTITVAGQTATLPFWTETFYTRCPKDMYGQVGEVCLDCPLGSDCAGGLEEPVSQPGFFILNDTTKNFCNPARQHREYCNHVVACEPKAACTGNNECAVGYISVAPVHRCAECADRYYRRAGECVECPDNPWILIAAFLAMAICLCVSGYILNRKAVNLAFLTIGMDYFQVLALFARSRVRWPAMIKDIFHIMSVFNLNLEITAPECSIPDLGYQAKWFGIETLPLAAAGLFLICHVAILFKKRCIMGRKKRLNSHASALVAMLLVMMYVLYLFITRTVLDVFNCAPTDPPDGHEYLEVVFEPCWEAGSIQMTLLPFAILALLGYTIGYPAVVWLALWKNKFKIMEDQLLRAKGMGNTRLQNPNACVVGACLAAAQLHRAATMRALSTVATSCVTRLLRVCNVLVLCATGTTFASDTPRCTTSSSPTSGTGSWPSSVASSSSPSPRSCSTATQASSSPWLCWSCSAATRCKSSTRRS